MELGGKTQVILYNAGLLIALIGLRTSGDFALIGIFMSWAAAAAALTKCWIFPRLARLSQVKRQSSAWWADPATMTE
jgi:hypothetical protein